MSWNAGSARGRKKYTIRYKWLNDLPLRDGRQAAHVNWFSIEMINERAKTTYRNSFVTSMTVTEDNVEDLAACGRARWKIENETFNVLKTKGYNLEHNFGARRQSSGRNAGNAQHAGLCHAYRVRHTGNTLAGRTQEPGCAVQLLQSHPHHRLLYGLSKMGGAHTLHDQRPPSIADKTSLMGRAGKSKGKAAKKNSSRTTKKETKTHN